jgi:hypothetical protein
VARPAGDPGGAVPPLGQRRHCAARGRVRQPLRTPGELRPPCTARTNASQATSTWTSPR